MHGKGICTVVALKDCMYLRARMGLKLAFLEDAILSMAIPALTSKPRKQLQEAVVVETQRLLQLAQKEKSIALLGPKGRLPRLKDELLKVAALLNITTSADATVEVLKSQISPTVKEHLSKPIPHPKSQGIRLMPVRRPVPVVKLDKDKSMEAEMLEEAGDRLLLGQEFWQGEDLAS
jgi:hypothetical protein